MKNLPKEKRDRLILIVLGTVVSLGLLWYLLIRAQEQSIKAIAQKTVEQKDKVGRAQHLISSKAEIEKNLVVAAQKLKVVEAGMASGDMYSWVILTINKFKADRNVDIPQFSREIPTDVGLLPRFPYKAALFHLRGAAYFHDFGKFLADFENAFPYIRVQNVELEPAGSSATSTGEPEKLGFRIEIVTLVNPNTH
jgi:hypothetical protein